MDPNAEENYRTLGLVLAVSGRPDDAQQVLREALTMAGSGSYTLATLGYALARGGQQDEARRVVAELEAHAQREYVSPVAFATVYLGLGDAEHALDWAERAWRDRRGWLAYLKVNPIFDPVRGQARFEELVRRMRL
jgi:eukaryotic-like serine/threonine-protein kinase